MKNESCLFCGKKFTLLCDNFIAFDAEKENGYLMSFPEKIYTCDAPMCRSCATFKHYLFFSSSNGHHRIETYDLCPLCESLAKRGKEIISYDRQIKNLTPDQVNVIRYRHWYGIKTVL